jgi:hypothetical protein
MTGDELCNYRNVVWVYFIYGLIYIGTINQEKYAVRGVNWQDLW